MTIALGSGLGLRGLSLEVLGHMQTSIATMVNNSCFIEATTTYPKP